MQDISIKPVNLTNHMPANRIRAVGYTEDLLCFSSLLTCGKHRSDMTTYVIAKTLYNCILVICSIKVMLFMVS